MGADATPTPRQGQGHSHCALRARLTHIRKASSYMGACVAPMPPRKRRAFNPKFCPSGIKLDGNCFMKQSRLRLENDARILSYGVFALWGCSPHALGNMGCCIPNCTLRRRKKATKRKYFAPPFHKKICASFMPEGQNLGLNALRLREGMGAAQAPISSHILFNPGQTLCRRGTIWV